MAAADPVRWRRIKAIFGEVYDLPGNERQAALARLCPADPDIREEVEALLDTARTVSGFLATLPAAATAFQLFGGTARFAIRRPIGSGSFGAVYEAWDRDWERPVALKLLKDTSPAFLALFKHEFRSLAGIVHPNLIRFHELFVDGPHWFFTMDLVEGVDLLSWVRPAGACDYQRLWSIYGQLVEALAFLHRLHQVHRDLKPANVLVTAAGQATVLDFGLVIETGGDALGRTGPVAGSPAYMAPEQAQNRPVGPAADWYSLGIMLFQALTGRLPFRGSEAEILAHKAQAAPLSGEFDPGIPEDWSRLCCRLLQTDPDARPSADELRAFFQAESAIADRRVAIPEDRFVGRESWLSDLREDFGGALQGKLVVSLIEGRPGIGKSVLVRQFLGRLGRDRDLLVLAGRCYECESVPYKALDSWIDQLAGYLGSLPFHDLESVLPRDAALLPTLFPVLGGIRSRRMEAGIEVPDRQELRRRAFSALIELLTRLSARRRVVIWVDDFQWGDLDSIAFLRELFSSAGGPGLLFLITYRSEDRESSSSIHALLGLREAIAAGNIWRDRQLGGLSADECRELAAHLVGSSGADAERIARESGGLPIFLEELANWSANRPAPVSLGEAIRERIRRMPETAARLVTAVALGGQPLHPRTALRAAGLASNEPIALCVSARLVRLHSTGSEGRLESYHDQVRAAAAEMLDPSSRRLLHRSLAEALSQDPDADPDSLIDHYVGAGETSAAADCALRAADAAITALAFERAAHLFLRAIELRGAAPDLLRRRGEALAFAGRSRDAAGSYLEAARLTSHRESLEFRHLACGQLLRAGRVDQGLELYRGLLRELGIRIPGRRWQLLAALVWYRLRAASGAGRRAVSADPFLLDVLWTGASILISSNTALGAYCHARFWLLARGSQDGRRLALATAFEAANQAVFGWHCYEKALGILARADAIAHTLDDPYPEAMICLMRAFIAYLTGRLTEIHPYAEQAEWIFRDRCRGVFWEITSARVLEIYTAGLTGDSIHHQSGLADLIQEARSRNDTYTESSLVLITFSHRPALFRDRPEEAIDSLDRALAAWGRREFDLQAMGYCVAITESFLYTGRAQEALTLIQRRWKPAVTSLLLRWQILNILLTHVRGRCALAAENAWEARACIRRLLATRSPYGRAAALSLRAAQLVPHDRAAAIAALSEAVVTFEQIGLQLYAVACRRRLAQLQSDTTSIASADAWMCERDIERPDRIAAWVLPGKWGEHGTDAN